MKVLCACVPGYGHYMPMVGIARALQVAGHDVTFVTGPGFEHPVADGFSMRVAGEDIVSPAMRAIAAVPQYATMSQTDQRRFLVGRVFAGERLATGFDDEYAAACDIDPDVVIHDPMELAAPLIAAMLDRPSVCAGYGLPFRTELLEVAADGVSARWRQHGLDVPADAGIYGNLYLDPCPPSMVDPDVPAPPTRQGVRPGFHDSSSAVPERFGRLGTQRPLAYATLGTVFGHAGLEPLVMMIDGLRRLDVDVVATVGPNCDPGAIDRDDESVLVERFVPQDPIMARCALAVVHGGSGSVLGAMSHGLPTVVVPLGADQFINAAAVERAGAGIAVPPHRLTVDSVAEAATHCLKSTDLRDAANRVAAEIAALPTPTQVVPRIQQLVA